MTAGGFEPTALKKENGARLGTPAAEIVETKATGRGSTEETRILKLSRPSRSPATSVSNWSKVCISFRSSRAAGFSLRGDIYRRVAWVSHSLPVSYRASLKTFPKSAAYTFRKKPAHPPATGLLQTPTQTRPLSAKQSPYPNRQLDTKPGRK